MAAPFDPADEYVRSVLDRAKVHGEISLADLESIIEAGIEAKATWIEDVADTIEALAEMGIEVDNGLTEEQEDAECLRAKRDFVRPVWTAEAVDSPGHVAGGPRYQAREGRSA